MPARSREAHNLIASDRIEGTPVRGTTGHRIGTIERVMIDKLTGNVVYAVLSFGGFLGIGRKHLPIPWSRLTYDRNLAAYHIDLTDEELSRASNKDFDWGERDPEIDEYYRMHPHSGLL